MKYKISQSGFIQNHFFSKKNSAGFIALTAILIISAVILLIGTGVALRSVGEMKMSFNEEKSNQTLSLVNTCAEIALMKLLSVLNYSGNESIIIGGESCDIITVAGSGNTNRTVQAQSTVDNYTKKVQIEVTQISPVMQISSWEEVSDF